MKAYYSCHGTLMYKSFNDIDKAKEFMQYMAGECKILEFCIVEKGEILWFNDFFLEGELELQLKVLVRDAMEDKNCK